MAALNFPNSPTDGQTYTLNGTNWVYRSAVTAWVPYNPVTDMSVMSLTTSTTTADQVVGTIASGSYRSIKFQVQVVSGTAYQTTELLLVHDGTTVYLTEYGTVLSGSSLASFNADINAGNIRLLVTPVNAVTTIKAFGWAITV